MDELLPNLSKRTPSSFFAATRLLRANELQTRVSRVLAQETLLCGSFLAKKYLDRPEDPDGLTKCGKILDESLSLAQRLLAGGVLVSGNLMCKIYYSMSELAKISDRRDDQIVHLQQALEISDNSAQTTAMELLLTEALVETGNFRNAKFIAERLYDKLRRAGRWMADAWDALEYVIVLSLVLQTSLALNERSAAALYLDLGRAVAALVQAKTPRHVATPKIKELVNNMEIFNKRIHDH